MARRRNTSEVTSDARELIRVDTKRQLEQSEHEMEEADMDSVDGDSSAEPTGRNTVATGRKSPHKCHQNGWVILKVPKTGNRTSEIEDASHANSIGRRQKRTQ